MEIDPEELKEFYSLDSDVRNLFIAAECWCSIFVLYLDSIEHSTLLARGLFTHTIFGHEGPLVITEKGRRFREIARILGELCYE